MVLLYRHVFDNFWALSGETCELLENSKDTLKREMKEELNIIINLQLALYFVENFFDYKSIPHHELGIFYLMQIPDNHYSYNQKETFKGREGETELIFKWFKIEKLGEIVLYPSFLKDKLRDIKSYPEHIICRDD